MSTDNETSNTALVQPLAEHPLAVRFAELRVTLPVKTVKVMSLILGHWGWKPATLLRRMEEALVTLDAQLLYLEWAVHYRIQPETLAKLLAVYQGRHEFDANILREVALVDNKQLRYASGKHFAMFLNAALELLNKVPLGVRIPISVETAGIIAKEYGDFTEGLVEDILANAGNVAEKLEIVSEDETVILSQCLRWIAALIERGETLGVVSICDFFSSGEFRLLRDRHCDLTDVLGEAVDIMELNDERGGLPADLEDLLR